MSKSIPVDGVLVNQLRMRCVFGLGELAVAAKLSPKVVRKAVRGDSISPTALRKVAAALKVEPRRLVARSMATRRAKSTAGSSAGAADHAAVATAV